MSVLDALRSVLTAPLLAITKQAGVVNRSLGHRRITHLDGGDNPVSAERCRGYVEAMTSAGLAHHVRVEPGGLPTSETPTIAKPSIASATADRIALQDQKSRTL